MCSEFLLVAVKALSHECGGRILLGDNRGGGSVTLRQIKFRCVGIWISNGLPFYTHTVEHVSTRFHQAPDLWNLTTA